MVMHDAPTGLLSRAAASLASGSAAPSPPTPLVRGGGGPRSSRDARAEPGKWLPRAGYPEGVRP